MHLILTLESRRDDTGKHLSTKGENHLNFLAQLLKGIAFVPAIVHGIEALFGSKTGTDKKAAAMSFISAALSITDAVTNKQIVDPNKFQGGSVRSLTAWSPASTPVPGHRKTNDLWIVTLSEVRKH